ncbi:hypothetical protein [Cetobacterium sp.]|uniref:hypothetical protein n=1 Tax=Cetobacterium sp. TaxID=2071632 RepID=UPI003F2DA03B
MARKKEASAKREIYCIRISEEEKILLKNNPTLKKELDDYIRMYLNAFKITKEQ